MLSRVGRVARCLGRGVLGLFRILGPLRVLALVLVLELPLVEFVSLQRQTDRERRRRFGLPEECEPRLTAARATRGFVVVLVTCAESERDGDESSWGRPRPELAD